MSHDASYKLLFSHARMVADLLRGFVPADWVEQLDLESLERVSGSYVSADLRDRHNDVVWRLRWGPRWLYVYLLIEFQSSVDRWMAARISTYVGLLHQDLIKAEQLSPNGLLPPVLPIVLYNGARPWSSPTSLTELLEPPPSGLERFQPTASYLLLQERSYGAEALAKQERNLVAALFQLENSVTPGAVREVVLALKGWLSAPEQASLRDAFVEWIGRVLLPLRLPGAEIPEVRDLTELETMLAERVVEWTEDWKQQGLLQGLQQARAEERQLLLRQAELRFGSDCAAALAPLMADIDDQAVLTQIGEWIIQSPDGDSLISQAQTLTD